MNEMQSTNSGGTQASLPSVGIAVSGHYECIKNSNFP